MEPTELTEQMERPDRLVLQALLGLMEQTGQMELTERLGQRERQGRQGQRDPSEAPGPLIICRSSPGRRRSRIQSFSRHNRAAGATSASASAEFREAARTARTTVSISSERSQREPLTVTAPPNSSSRGASPLVFTPRHTCVESSLIRRSISARDTATTPKECQSGHLTSPAGIRTWSPPSNSDSRCLVQPGLPAAPRSISTCPTNLGTV